jgi:hypothetical protein
VAQTHLPGVDRRGGRHPRVASPPGGLNWSQRRQWQGSAPEVTLFREFVGGGGFSREYNPVAVIVPPRGRRVHIVRFWRAFRDYKHGRTRRLREAEAELERGLTTVQS